MTLFDKISTKINELERSKKIKDQKSPSTL